MWVAAKLFCKNIYSINLLILENKNDQSNILFSETRTKYFPNEWKIKLIKAEINDAENYEQYRKSINTKAGSLKILI